MKRRKRRRRTQDKGDGSNREWRRIMTWKRIGRASHPAPFSEDLLHQREGEGEEGKEDEKEDEGEVEEEEEKKM